MTMVHSKNCYHHYAAHGLHFASELRCPEWQRCDPDATALDVTIRFGKAPETLEAARGCGVLYAARPNHYLLTLQNVARYHVHGGNEIVIEAMPNSSEEDIRLFLSGAPLGALLYQRGILTFHGSAVETDWGGVVFVGASGVGKSTLAAAMKRRGYCVLADELCAVRFDQEGVPHLFPGERQIRLWRDVIEKMDVNIGAVSSLRPGIEKYALDASNRQAAGRPVPLRHLYVLTVTNRDTLRIETFSGRSKLTILYNQLYACELLKALAVEKAMIKGLARLASQIEVSNVIRPYGPLRVNRLADLIESGLQRSSKVVVPQAKSVFVSPVLVEAAQPQIQEREVESKYCGRGVRSVTEDQSGNIIWLASYPKSGNTWLRVFLANYLSASQEPVDINALATDKHTGMLASQRKLFDDGVGVEASNLTEEEIELYRPHVYVQLSRKLEDEQTETFFMKTHDAFLTNVRGEPLFPKAATRGVIYLVRNPLDVVVSYAKHFGLSIETSVRALNNQKHCLAGDQLKLNSQLRQHLLSWSQHISSWVDQSELPLHVMRYEDMKRSPLATFREALRFADLPERLHDLEDALQKSSLRQLRDQERKKGFGENPRQTHAFFGRGQIGGWRRVLTKEQVASVIEVHGEMMQRFDYLTPGGEPID